MNLYTQIKHSVKDGYRAVATYTHKPYMKEALIVVVAGIVITASYFAYGWYQKQQDMKAFAGLVEITKSYEAAVNKARELESKPEDERTENPWEDTELLLESLSYAHRGSSLAPFFVLYQAQLALDKNHDYDTAYSLMEKGVARLSKKSIYYDMFNMKRIKMLLDSPEQNVRDKAVAELEKIGNSAHNYYAQEALTTAAMYHEFHGNMDAAVAAWTKIAQAGSSQDKDIIVNPWVEQAQEKLKTLHIAL